VSGQYASNISWWWYSGGGGGSGGTCIEYLTAFLLRKVVTAPKSSREFLQKLDSNTTPNHVLMEPWLDATDRLTNRLINRSYDGPNSEAFIGNMWFDTDQAGFIKRRGRVLLPPPGWDSCDCDRKKAWGLVTGALFLYFSSSVPQTEHGDLNRPHAGHQPLMGKVKWREVCGVLRAATDMLQCIPGSDGEVGPDPDGDECRGSEGSDDRPWDLDNAANVEAIFTYACNDSDHRAASKLQQKSGEWQTRSTDSSSSAPMSPAATATAGAGGGGGSGLRGGRGGRGSLSSPATPKSPRPRVRPRPLPTSHYVALYGKSHPPLPSGSDSKQEASDGGNTPPANGWWRSWNERQAEAQSDTNAGSARSPHTPKTPKDSALSQPSPSSPTVPSTAGEPEPHLSYIGFQLALVAIARTQEPSERTASPVRILMDMLVRVLVPCLTLIYTSDLEVSRQRIVDEETRALKSPKVASLFERNRLSLWNLYRHYCSPKGGGVGRQHMSLTFDQAWALACDFNICPPPYNAKRRVSTIDGGDHRASSDTSCAICTLSDLSLIFDSTVLLDANATTKKKSHKPIHNIDFEGFIRLVATIAMRHVRTDQDGVESSGDGSGQTPAREQALGERRIVALLDHMQNSHVSTLSNLSSPGGRSPSTAGRSARSPAKQLKDASPRGAPRNISFKL